MKKDEILFALMLIVPTAVVGLIVRSGLCELGKDLFDAGMIIAAGLTLGILGERGNYYGM
jgi:hypothetical protein